MSETPQTLEIGGHSIAPGGRIGPYLYVKRVGKGGMADVLLCRDPNDEPVALKVLKGSRLTKGSALQRFRREFRALSRVRHPNVIHVDAYGDLYGQPYIAMEYVEGKDLHQTIRAFRFLEDPAERWRRCEEILVDLCRALAHVHQKGLVHRDLKPSNILIDPQGRAKLTDFGIVKDLDPDDAFRSGTLVGTWAYASPEQITGGAIDHRSDLYSLGILLFAMLTGYRPFDAKDMAGYLEAHTKQKPPSPRDLEPKVPKHLDEICSKLLEKSPKDRFQSAREILYRLEQLQPDRPEVGDEDWVPPLVGRGAELELLQDAVDRLTVREGGVVTLRGRVGMGRTRLLDAAEHRAGAIGIPVHRLSPRRENLYGLLTLCEQVLEAAPHAHELEEAVRELKDGRAHGDALYRLTDRLRPVMAQLLEKGPRALLFDDVQELPRRGVDLLETLIRSLVAAGQPLLVVLSVQEGGLRRDTQALLDGQELGVTPRQIRLEPLSMVAVETLVRTLLGDSGRSQALARRLHKETEGNPLFISQFLESLLQSGLIEPTPKGLRLAADTEEVRTGHLEIPRGVQQVVAQRLRDLGGAERAVLEVLAVNSGPLDLDHLLEVLGKDEDDVLDQLDALITSGLIRERRRGHQVIHETAHRLQADVVYRALDTERRVELHRALALSLEEAAQVDPRYLEQVGEHFRLAGEAGKAFVYLSDAAERMQGRSMPRLAWDLSTRAMAVEEMAATDLGPAAFREARTQLLGVRAAILYLRGEWEDCRKTCLGLLRGLEGHGPHAAAVRARATLGRCLARMEQPIKAIDQVDLALKEARQGRLRAAVAEALYARAALAFETGDLEAVQSLSEEGLLMCGRRDVVRGDLQVALSAAQAAQGQIHLASRGLEQAEALFKELGQKDSRCVALTNLAEMRTWQGQLREAQRIALEARSLAEEIHFRVGRGSALRVYGEALLEAGDDSGARKALGQALSEVQPLGVFQETIACRFSLARLSARIGDPGTTESHLAIARNLARKQDPESYLPALVALSAWACALTGDAGDARRMLKTAEYGVGKLPVPRRARVLMECARAYAVLLVNDEAERLARDAAHLSSARGLKLLDLEARRLLAALAERPQDAQAWASEADAIAESLKGELPEWE
ncbi:MAG: protein kinase [Myxococcota bacterium]|nr:protein kinase [Myxococcota bacterium]